MFTTSLYARPCTGTRGIDGGFSSGALGLDADRHVVRVCNAGADAWHAAVYVSAGTQSVVLVLRLTWPHGRTHPTVQHVASHLMAADNVINMHVAADHVWVVTSNTVDGGAANAGNAPLMFAGDGGEGGGSLVPNKVLHVSLRGGGGVPVATVPALTTDDVHAVVPVPATSDPRAVYCAYIFNGKRFSRSVIANALHLYAGAGGDYADDGGRDALLIDVTGAVEDKIRASGLSFEADALRAQETQHWQEFLRCCTHFWRQERTVLGMFEDARTGFAFVLNHAGVDLLRPCTALVDTISALADTTASDAPVDPDADASAATVRLDIRRVLDCLHVADVVLGDTMTRAMFESPREFFEDAAADVVQQVEDVGSGLRDDVAHMVAVLAPIAHPQQAFACVLEGAFGVYPRDRIREFPMDADEDQIDWEVRSHMFGSVEGVALVAEGLR